MIEDLEGAEAVTMALALLWTLDESFDEVRRVEGFDAAINHWLLYSRDCKRWIATAVAGGRARDLPPDLLRKRAVFNLHDWRIPNV